MRTPRQQTASRSRAAAASNRLRLTLDECDEPMLTIAPVTPVEHPVVTGRFPTWFHVVRPVLVGDFIGRHELIAECRDEDDAIGVAASEAWQAIVENGRGKRVYQNWRPMKREAAREGV